ncbi:toxin Fic [Candidatus Magnetobacterium bavaricum]|uniref:Toxin Fic n=1 Tax=Candidatus Magnetobacterium bavaricum TaxID=29290 RepID=A0A0F3GLA2_9BACT|nr:toxin Fic [Candidatus Magnetobacterium bavaricum]
MEDNNMLPKTSDIIFYSSADGNVHVEVFFEDETFWLSQKRMAELFGVESHTITYHLKEIFKSGELQEDSVTRKIRVTADDGKNYLTNLYNLDAIIAVGYRVNSYQATQFRIWATRTLKEFIIKGFVLDDERLKQGQRFGKDYFDELIERIREIRASERRFYQKLTDIYKECSLVVDDDVGVIVGQLVRVLANDVVGRTVATRPFRSAHDQQVKPFGLHDGGLHLVIKNLLGAQSTRTLTRAYRGQGVFAYPANCGVYRHTKCLIQTRVAVGIHGQDRLARLLHQVPYCKPRKRCLTRTTLTRKCYYLRHNFTTLSFFCCYIC